MKRRKTSRSVAHAQLLTGSGQSTSENSPKGHQKKESAAIARSAQIRCPHWISLTVATSGWEKGDGKDEKMKSLKF
jgi:hypothetical protein